MNEPMKPVIEIVRVTDVKGWYSYDVRVGFTVTRHGGKLIANCPSEKLAELVKDSILTIVLQDGVSWDIEFEVKQPTPILVTDSNFDQVFPSGWTTPKDEHNPE